MKIIISEYSICEKFNGDYYFKKAKFEHCEMFCRVVSSEFSVCVDKTGALRKVPYKVI